MSIDIDAVVSRMLPSSGDRTTVETRIDAVGKTKPTSRHVVLLVDTSGSMDGRKIENAKDGAKRALQELDDDDYVGIVGFDSSPETVLPMTRWEDTDQRSAEDDIDAITAINSTDIYQGLEASRDQLIEDVPDDPHSVKRIILLSDGQDWHDASTYRGLASEFDEEGISIMAGGIGSAYDEGVMVALANGSGGEAADLSEGDIDEFLGETVSETDSVVASNPQLRIDPAERVIVVDEPAYLDAPKTERRAIDTDSGPAMIKLPELTLSDPHRLTFELLSQPKPAGKHRLVNLAVIDETNSVLAETTVEVEYEDEPGIKRVSVEKNREAAKVRTDVQDPGITKREVKAAIEELEENEGWTDLGIQLRDDLKKADEDGGIVRLSRSNLDAEGD